MASVFTKIIQGEIPSYKIFENEHVYCCLTLDQVQLGHTLIFPKVEVDHLMEVPEPYYSSVFKTARFLSKAIYKATGCRRVGLAVVGFEVPHFHLHLIPMQTSEDLNFRKGQQRSNEECLTVQEKIVGELNQLMR